MDEWQTCGKEANLVSRVHIRQQILYHLNKAITLGERTERGTDEYKLLEKVAAKFEAPEVNP